GQPEMIGSLPFIFGGPPQAGAVNIRYQGDSLLIAAPFPLVQTVMATQAQDTLLPGNGFQPLALRALYAGGGHQFVVANFTPTGRVDLQAGDRKMRAESFAALQLAVSINGQTTEAVVLGRGGQAGRPATIEADGLRLRIAYGARTRTLPFSLHLHDFEMETYPGTNSAASYASEVRLVDPRDGTEEDYRIYMNHILTHDGYRFFQSSYDRDERGTYLSVNHDYWGSLVSYLGYALLTLGMVWTLFSRQTRFHRLRQDLVKIRQKRLALSLLLMLGSASLGKAQETPTPEALAARSVPAEHAGRFAELVVQDFRGRMKPVHTLSREVMRKVSRQESYAGLNPDQLLLNFFAEPNIWQQVPLIKIGRHPRLFDLLDLPEGQARAAFADCFGPDGSYLLRDAVREANNLDPGSRGTFEKELLKLDERVNIMRMALSGSFLKLIPNPASPTQTWLSAEAQPHSHQHNHATEEDQYLHTAAEFFQAYRAALVHAIENGHFDQPDQLLAELATYQQRQGEGLVPSPGKLRAEIWLNQSRVFQRLAGTYGLLGLLLLGLLFYSVFAPQARLRGPLQILLGLMTLAFAFHTLGLGLRWYVSGRAPWSNGYESMIYIGWTTALAGILFARRSAGGLAATAILATTILFVATLSFLDPEITPLVPVLRSYWLTIHVSLEAGSYGFLLLGAIIGLINLLLMVLLRPDNKARIRAIIQEMSILSEMTLTAGLFMLSIGTYLGGVWANESWGRYWGWDAKETWALVSILVYAFILHMRLIPKLFGLFSYNLATVFGMASVIMTYYGVNYYLSGLHSYATGDPVPIPTWVYVFVSVVVGLSVAAFVQKRKHLDKR
ncbi:MAG: cytochrome C biogenesis protein, partial [Bacteroidetes bacterium]